MVKNRLITGLFLLCCPVCIRSNTGGLTASGNPTGLQAVYACPVDSLKLTFGMEDKDGIFLSPQPVAFTVQTDRAADPSGLNLICIVTTDNYLPVDSLVVAAQSEASGAIGGHIAFTPPVAGFYRISIYAANGREKSQVLQFNVGYDPEQIVSPPDAKADFGAFWDATRTELAGIAPRYKMTLLEEKSSAVKNMYHVEMYSLGDIKIEGYYSVPKTPGKHPAIIRFMGYAANPRFLDPNALPDFCEFILSVRGQGIQKPVNTYGEWILHGLSDKANYYYRGAYMDLIRGIDFLTSRPEVDLLNIMAEGSSQGGALALAACALDKRIKAATPRIPFLSDFRDYFQICPWPRSLFERYLQEHPGETWENIYDVLSYFDIKNLVGQITCPVLMGVGLQDETCPPHTNFAGYNQICSEKSYIVYPYQKHSVDESWWPLREAFFREKLGAAPSGRK